MNRAIVAALLCVPALLPAAASGGDDIQARKNFGKELAACAGYYSLLARQQNIDASAKQDFAKKSNTAIDAAARVTDRQFALTREQEALASGEGLNGPHCDEVMAHPQERFAYWRGK